MSLNRIPAAPAIPESSERLDQTHGQVRQSEVLSALSYALDLTEGQPEGHTLRSCAIGMRISSEIGLPADQQAALYYALLLKDAGCSSNAARMATLFGSADQQVKFGMKLVDWHKAIPLALRTARMVGLGDSVLARIRHFLKIARGEDITRELIQIRCDRGADIVRNLGFPDATSEAVRCLDEHWCGLGYPEGRVAEDIPLLSRIANLSQTLEIYTARYGVERALNMARARSGRWFEPRLVRVVVGWKLDHDWWTLLASPDVERWVVEHEPTGNDHTVDDDRLDEIATAFAGIIDAKSPYTYSHSSNVAAYARAIAAEMGMDGLELRNLYRAGLLHDIGKLGISSRILDKNGPLDDEERAEINLHPLYSWQILSRVDAFLPFARAAVVHHEKLDGSGYPWGISADQLSPAERALCVADIFEALTADRPYRAGMPYEKAMSILHREIPGKLCETAVGALEAAVSGGAVRIGSA